MGTWGNYEKCPVCGEYGWAKTHKCVPTWSVVGLSDLPDTEADPDLWHKVHARDEAEAAQKFIERGDRRDAEFTEDAVVAVRDPRTGATAFYQVQGELVPEYRAEPLADLDTAKAEYKHLYGCDAF